jgi:hypothetical protein
MEKPAKNSSYKLYCQPCFALLNAASGSRIKGYTEENV